MSRMLIMEKGKARWMSEKETENYRTRLMGPEVSLDNLIGALKGGHVFAWANPHAEALLVADPKLAEAGARMLLEPYARPTLSPMKPGESRSMPWPSTEPIGLLLSTAREHLEDEAPYHPAQRQAEAAAFALVARLFPTGSA